ncbi:hypothetical protein [Streptomyces sp. NBC_01506]|uniref:hypothetical protein n=1 Tax=Streptomyces sp. NBC_01506 TaxID=2903887 RepID=UPI0038641147
MLRVATLVVAAACAGQSHPFDAARLHTWLDKITTNRAGNSRAAILLTVAAALLTAGAAGLAAGGLGGLLQRPWGAASSPTVINSPNRAGPSTAVWARPPSP